MNFLAASAYLNWDYSSAVEVEMAPQKNREQKALTDKGLLQRVGNGYAPTEHVRKQPRQDTL